MPVPRCDTCKHWDAYGSYGPPELGICQQTGNDAKFSSNESGGGEVETHNDFGCVQWEAK